MDAFELATDRLRLTPLDSSLAGQWDESECYEAQEHWTRHGFGSWAVREREGRLAGVAELHYAYPGVTGISTGEVEAGWTIVQEARGRGLATEAMRAAIADVWNRAGIQQVVAYIRPENAPSLGVAEKLGFVVRGPGLTRSGDPMTVFELHAP